MIIQRTASPTVLSLVLGGALASLPTTASAKAVGSVAVERIETKTTETGREVVIHTSKDPTFSVFRLSDPFRVLVDVNDANVPSAIDLMKVRDGVLRYVSTSPFADESSAIVRVEIALEAQCDYRVRPEGKSIVVSIMAPGSGSAEPASAKPQAVAAPVETAKPAVESEAEGSATPAKRAGAKLGTVSKKVEKSKTSLLAKIEKGTIEPSMVKIERLDGPARIVVDVAGAEIAPKWQKVDLNTLGVKRARVGTGDDGVRVVFDLVEGKPAPAIDVDSDGHALRFVLSKAQVASAAPKVEAAPEEPKVEARKSKVEVVETPAVETAAIVVEPEPKIAAQIAPASKLTGRITDIKFEPKDGFVRLTVVVDGTSSVEKDPQSNPEVPVIRVKGALLPSTFERTLDVTEVAGQMVSTISTYRDGNDTIIAANIGQGTEHRHWRKDNRLMWDFGSEVAALQKKNDTKVLTYPEQATSGYVSNATQIASSLTPSAVRYTGRRISLDLKDADIQNVLRLLADVSKLNIVAADDVKGRVTIKLKNVPWDQALDIILRSKQLDKTRSGNIIRIAPVEVLRKEEELRIERQKAKVELEPLAVRLIPVSYAAANDVKPQVTSLLSPRGKVNIDVRTNVLVVEDIPDVLTKVERLVRTLDTQTPQVLIEARIVEANTQFTRDLGIQWGGAVAATQDFGTSTGLQFPNNIRIAGGADDNQTPVNGTVGPSPNFAVNLPAAVGSGSGGALGFTFGSAGGAALIALRLSAAETTGKVKIISAPKIVTLDNKIAKIVSGEKIPITVVTANGPSTRFVDANLELNVTPHVTQDGSILLNVNAKKNELSQRRDLLGTPGIITKEAETEMLVRDGDTAVLGGIYRRNATESKAYVPWIGQIPVLGWFFKKTQRSDSREELLIFVSPRIVNRSQALVSTQ